MSDLNIDNKPAFPVTDRNADFFITELAHMSESYDRQYANVSRRLTVLEQNSKESYDDDPTKMIGSIVGIMIAMQLLPVIVDMVKAWRQPKA